MTEEFKVLTDREHILLRTGVYAGSVVEEPISGIIDYQYRSKMIVPALIKCIEEIVQNSIDEHIRTKGEFSTDISLSFESTIDGTQITVVDNGRGIPVEQIGNSYRPVLAWTQLRAGSNFDDSKGRITAGTNGMGSSIVNVLSKQFIGTSCDGKKKIVVSSYDNMSSIDFVISKTSNRGVSVQFIPDLERFGLTSFTQDHIDVITDRVHNLAIQYPNITFSINKEKIKFKNIKQVAKLFHPDAISVEDNSVAIVIAPSGDDEEFRCLSYVNGIYIKNGGSHIDFVVDRIIAILRESVKRKYKVDVLPNQIRQHLLIASWINDFPNLKFDSQSKERITNSQSEVSVVLGKIDFEKISRQILATPTIIDPMIAAILFKKELADKLALAKKQKSAAKLRVVNHIAATDTIVENKRLFLVEGLSALGPHIAVRNPKTDGAYPLKGKVMNVRGMKPVDIMQNKEIFELLSILGLELNKPATNLNYGKIIIFSDLDTDGNHIFGLLLNLFSNWPELFDEKRIYRCLAPLYYCTKGKDVKSFYTKEEFDKFNSKGWDVQFFKGLGSMPKEVYKECLHHSHLEEISANSADYDKLEMFFGNDASLRKTWMVG